MMLQTCWLYTCAVGKVCWEIAVLSHHMAICPCTSDAHYTTFLPLQEGTCWTACGSAMKLTKVSLHVADVLSCELSYITAVMSCTV